YIASFATNQVGSLIFVIALKDNDLSLVAPVVNALTFFFTFVFGRMLGEEKDSFNSYLGAFLILIGTSLCIVGRSN
ncbi:transmembrane protein 234-like protein, partial [Dinothrombium tinctorium]